MAQLSIIIRDNIHPIKKLEGKISKLKKSYEDTRQELNRLSARQEHMGGLLEQAELYFFAKRQFEAFSGGTIEAFHRQAGDGEQ